MIFYTSELTDAQVQDVIAFAERTHEELWQLNEGDVHSLNYADMTGLTAALRISDREIAEMTIAYTIMD